MHHRALPLLASIAVAAVILAVGYDVTRRAQGMRSGMAAVAASQPARPGASVQAVVQLAPATRPGRYPAAVLARVDETTYRATDGRLTVEVTPETRFVMGGAADLGPGGIVQVAGTITGEQVVRARRVVILTGYISVTAPSGR